MLARTLELKVRLPVELVDLIEQQAAKLGISRNLAIRSALQMSFDPSSTGELLSLTSEFVNELEQGKRSLAVSGPTKRGKLSRPRVAGPADDPTNPLG